MVWEKGESSSGSLYSRAVNALKTIQKNSKIRKLQKAKNSKIRKLQKAKNNKSSALVIWRKNGGSLNNYYNAENRIRKYAENLRNKFGHVNSTLKNPKMGNYYHRHIMMEKNKSNYEKRSKCCKT
jgi:hypothetical protein